MIRAEHDRADQIPAELARQGVAVGKDDIAVIVKIVAGNRAGLERAADGRFLRSRGSARPRTTGAAGCRAAAACRTLSGVR